MRSFVIGLGLLAASPALATDISVPFTGQRSNQLDLHAGVQPYGYGVALGGRFGVPIVHNGFVPAIDNSVYINFGVDLYNTYSSRLDRRGLALGIPVAMQWNFYFTEEWSAFGEAGVNFYAGPGTFDGTDAFLLNSSWLVTAVGGRYHLNDAMALQLRVGNPYVAFGIEMSL